MAETRIEWTGTILPAGSAIIDMNNALLRTGLKITFKSAISVTHDGLNLIIPGYTFNPWEGCEKVDAECKNCYAETLSNRWGRNVWGPAKHTKRLLRSESYWKLPLKWNEEAKRTGIRRKVFCASMADVFENHPDVAEARRRLWQLINDTPWLDWLIVTKRPENILSMVPLKWQKEPQKNLWLGTSVGRQISTSRIDALLSARHIAQVLFLSCEPLLERIDLYKYLWKTCPTCNGSMSIPVEGGGKACPTCLNHQSEVPAKLIDWVIAGGESGNRRRPIEAKWARELRDDCQRAGVAFFMKQMDKKQPIPEDLLVREYPSNGLNNYHYVTAI